MNGQQILRRFLGRRDGSRSRTGKVRKKTFGVADLAKHISALLPRALDLVHVFGPEGMDPAFREAIMVAVARTNACRYCAFAHREWALHEGLDPESLSQVERMERSDLDEVSWIALQFANALAHADFSSVPLDLEEQITDRLGSRDRRQIETVARFMTIANLTGNTVDALLARLEGRPFEGSRLADELAMTALFAAAAPWVVLLLAAFRRESPLEVVRAFRRFSEVLEAA